MVPAGLDLAILDDDARWADDTECADLLFAGTWFLHETLKDRYPKCHLLPRILQMGDRFEKMYADMRARTSAQYFYVSLCALRSRSVTIRVRHEGGLSERSTAEMLNP